MHYRDSVALRFIESLFRNRSLFVISVVTVSAITVLAVCIHGSKWQAEALTQIKSPDIATTIGETQNFTGTSPSEQSVNQLNDLLKDNLPGGFLDTALTAADLKTPINVDPRAKDPRYATLAKGLTVTSESDTMFAISLTWNDQGECERIVRAIQRQYIDEIGLEHATQSLAAAGFLNHEVNGYASRMHRAEQTLANYKLRHAGLMADGETSYLGQVATLEMQRDAAQIAVREASVKRDAYQQRLSQIAPTILLEQNLSESPLMTDLQQSMAQRDELLARYRPNHPAILTLDDQIDRLERDIGLKLRGPIPGDVVSKRQENPQYTAVGQQLLEAAIDVATRQAEITELDRQIAERKSLAVELPQQERNLNDKTLDYNILKDRYNATYQKREEVAMQGALDKVFASSTLRPIGVIYAEPAMTHVKLALICLGGVVLGLIIGGLLLMLSEWSDRSLRHPADVEALLRVPMLAAVPELGSTRRQTVTPSGSGPDGDGRFRFRARPDETATAGSSKQKERVD